MAEQFHIVKHSDPSLDQMKILWDRLEGGAVASPFQLPSFLDALQSYALPPGSSPLTVLSASLNEGKSLIALLPLMTLSRGPARVVTMPDLGLADQNAPILSRYLASDPDMASAVCEELLQAVGGGDVLDIPKIGSLIGTRANPLFDRPGTVEAGCTYWFDRKGLATIDAQGGKSVFKEARTKLRKLQQHGVELVEVTDRAARHSLLEQLLGQRKVRFASLDRKNSLETGNRASFYRALSQTEASESPFRMFAFKKGEEVVAAVGLMVHDESANGILISIGDASWHRLSPGIVLVVQSLRWARENGVQNFSLGTGLQNYKKRFGATEQPIRRLLRPLSLKGRILLWGWHVKERVRSFWKMLEKAPDD